MAWLLLVMSCNICTCNKCRFVNFIHNGSERLPWLMDFGAGSSAPRPALAGRARRSPDGAQRNPGRSNRGRSDPVTLRSIQAAYNELRNADRPEFPMPAESGTNSSSAPLRRIRQQLGLSQTRSPKGLGISPYLRQPDRAQPAPGDGTQILLRLAETYDLDLRDLRHRRRRPLAPLDSTRSSPIRCSTRSICRAGAARPRRALPRRHPRAAAARRTAYACRRAAARRWWRRRWPAAKI